VIDESKQLDRYAADGCSPWLNTARTCFSLIDRALSLNRL
jgi:hypothetical protein